MSVVRIAVVYPDLLGTYGDGGNGEILVQRLLWRGIEAELLEAVSSEPLPEAELYCLGGGEDGPQVLAASRLIEDGRLRRAHRDGAVVFAVCAGFQIIGNSFPDASGGLHEGLGLLDIETRKGSGPRAVGEVAVEVTKQSDGGLCLPIISGFENHGGVTALASGVTPLGTVLSGIGNGAGDGSEGAIGERVVGTYLHGPVLARNPALADHLLAEATLRASLSPLDDHAEEELRQDRLRRLGLASDLSGTDPTP